MSRKRTKQQTIEDKFNRLAEIVAEIDDDVPLEMAIALYKEGIGLVQECGSQLARHEEEVMVLGQSAEGMFVMEPFCERNNGG